MQNYMPQYRPMVYRTLPVSSEAEMNSITVDFNGTPTYFHNQLTNEIYVKQFDIKTGLTTTQKFIKSDGTEGQEPKGNVKSDIDYSENFNAINDRIDVLKSMIEKLAIPQQEIEVKGGKK